MFLLVSSLGIASPECGQAFAVYDCISFNESHEVETSSLKGIGKVCKGRNERKVALRTITMQSYLALARTVKPRG
jgi:hypothetical protein